MVVLSISIIDWVLSISMLCHEVRPLLLAAERHLPASRAFIVGGVIRDLSAFVSSSDPESSATFPAFLPPAELVPDEKDAEVHQEDFARDCQVASMFVLFYSQSKIC